MNHSKSRKRKARKRAVAEVGQDFISNLPEDIKANILSYLSTRAAVQTSILSSKWRNTWTSIPEVSVREADFVYPRAIVHKTAIRTRLIKFVDALLYHRKPAISKFILEADKDKDYHYAFCRWILHLSSRKELREFSFNSYSINLYMLPTSLFSCHGLSILKLHECSIKLPTGFQGFKSMYVLELQRCLISEYDLEKIVSNCPSLVELVLKMRRSRAQKLNASPSFKIHAPKLKKLTIYGGLSSILLKTPYLVKANFELWDPPARSDGRCNLVEALGSLSEIEVLNFHEHFLVYLLAGILPNRLPLSFNELRILALDVDLDSPEEASLIRLLLENSPNLQELQMAERIRNKPLNLVKSSQSIPPVYLTSLRLLELYEFFISKSEIAFVKFILASAPLLEQLIIVTDGITDAMKKAIFEILEGISKYPRNLNISFDFPFEL